MSCGGRQKVDLPVCIFVEYYSIKSCSPAIAPLSQRSDLVAVAVDAWLFNCGQLPVPKCAAIAELKLARERPDHAGHDSRHANGLRYGHANGGHDECK